MERMEDFEEEINASFHKWKEGDVIQAEIVKVEEEEVTLDLHSYETGVIPKEEYSNDPDFHAMDELKVGDLVKVTILYEDEEGRIVTSLRQAATETAWEALRDARETQKIYEVTVKEEVPSGVITYVEGIRGFIPASQLDLHYVEDPGTYVGEKVSVQVITVEEEQNRLVLSAKEVKKQQAAKAHEKQLQALQKGFVTEGEVVRIEPYGCFVEIGPDLTGLVHISQITNKFLHSPNEVVKLGMKVNVKVLDVEDGKIRLSMKALEDETKVERNEEEPEIEYSDEGEATTSLGSLLQGLQLEE